MIRRSLSLFVILILLGCGGTKPSGSAEELMKKADMELSNRNYSEVVNHLRNLVEQFPQDPLAVEAQYRLGDTYMAYIKDFQQAIVEYRAVVENFKDSPIAPNSQFMIGYIYANYLEDFAKARSEYEKFLKNFSNRADSGLVQSVKFELENMGRNLDQIPQLKHLAF